MSKGASIWRDSQTHIPEDAHFYLCGPPEFLAATRCGLRAAGYADASISSELFGALDALRPGVASLAASFPHPPKDERGEGAVVSFVRSGLTVHWNGNYPSLLELAEACDVPVRWSCRTGVCHNCETSMIGGRVTYSPEPLEAPADGRILICCSSPMGDLQLDL